MTWKDINKEEPDIGERILQVGKRGGLYISRYIGNHKARANGYTLMVERWTDEIDTPFDPYEYQPLDDESVVCRGKQGGLFIGRCYHDYTGVQWESCTGVRTKTIAWGYPPED